MIEFPGREEEGSCIGCQKIRAKGWPITSGETYMEVERFSSIATIREAKEIRATKTAEAL